MTCLSRVTYLSRVIAACLGATLLIAACTSSDEDPTGSSTTAGGQAAGSVSDTTQPPNILALTPNIDLEADQCWAELPPPPESTTTTTDPDVTTTTVVVAATAATKPEPLGDLATTIPQPTIVAMVDCLGSNEGQVFWRFCLGENTDEVDPTNPELIAVTCDSASELGWPGDRTVRRAAVRLCLAEFRQQFGENYSETELVVREFAPTEGIWERGLHSVVCWLDAAS